MKKNPAAGRKNSTSAPACSCRRWMSRTSSPTCWSPKASRPWTKSPTCPSRNWLTIEGFDAEIGEELRNRARDWLSQEEDRRDEERKQIGVTDEVAALEGLTPSMMVILGNNNIKTLDDVGDLAGDELSELLAAHEMTEETANEIVMAARAHWFDE